MNLEAVTSPHNLKSLRRLYDQIESHTRSLKSLGMESSSYGGLLASVVLNKLPQEFQLFVSRKVGDSEWELEQMMKIIEEEIQAHERMVAVTNTPTRKPNRDPPTVASLLTKSNNSGPSCSYCQQAYSSNSCENVTHPTARRQILQKGGRCFLCLRRGHLSLDCHSPNKCRKCGGKHHISICFKNVDTPGPTGSGTPTGVTSSQPNPIIAPSLQGSHSTDTSQCLTELSVTYCC